MSRSERGLPRRRGRLAFTLVEVLVSTLLLAVILGVGYYLMNRTFFGMERHRQQLDTQNEARLFLAMIERDLREMTRLVKLDTMFPSEFSAPRAGYFKSMTLEIPDRQVPGALIEVTYSYEGPENFDDRPGVDKVVYRQEAGRARKPLINKQLKRLRVFGTDGTIFRGKGPTETEQSYMTYLQKHYYHPANPVAGGLRDLAAVKGVEIRLEMVEYEKATGEDVKTRLFQTRVYSRILNSKYE